MIRRIGGLSEIEAGYDAFIVDLWGVVHDGVRPYPAALEALSRLAGRPVLLLSNAPRRAASAQGMLRRMGVDDGLYTGILTSGEAVWMALRDRADAWFARLGGRVFHLGPARDRNVFAGLGLEVAASPEAADFVINTGPDDDSLDPGTLDNFLPVLSACFAAGLPMICANPDLVVMRDGVRILCAGTLARHYGLLGGDVVSIGKPDPKIYRLALAMLGVSPERVLAIGDSLHTDIGGAKAAGIDGLWVLGGIHAAAVADDDAQASAEAKAWGLAPVAMIGRLGW